MTSSISDTHKQTLVNSHHTLNENTQHIQKHSFIKFSDKYKDISNSSESESENRQIKILQETQKDKPALSLKIVKSTERNVLRENAMNEITHQVNANEKTFVNKEKISESLYGETEHEVDIEAQKSKEDMNRFAECRLTREAIYNMEKKQELRDWKLEGCMHEHSLIGNNQEEDLLGVKLVEYKNPEDMYEFEYKRSFLSDMPIRGLIKQSTDRQEAKNSNEILKEDHKKVTRKETKSAIKVLTRNINEKLNHKTKPVLEISTQAQPSKIHKKTKLPFEISPILKEETKSLTSISPKAIHSSPLNAPIRKDLPSCSKRLINENPPSLDFQVSKSNEPQSPKEVTSYIWKNNEICSSISSSSSSEELAIRDIIKLPTLKKFPEDECIPPDISQDLERDNTINEIVSFKIPKIKSQICREVLHIETPSNSSTGEKISENEIEILDKSINYIKTDHKQDTFSPTSTLCNSKSVAISEFKLQPPIISVPKDDEERIEPSDQIHRENEQLSQSENRPSDELLNIDEALRLLQQENLSDKISAISSILEKVSFMDCFTSCFTNNSDQITNQADKDARNCLIASSSVMYSDTNPFHKRILMSIWRHYTGAYDNCQKTGDHWKNLGFTQKDPTQELGNSNLFGLICLLFLGCVFKEDVIKMLDRSRTSEYSFHFASISLKMSEITLEAVKHKSLNSTINHENSAYDVILYFYGGLMLKWFDSYVSNNCNENRGDFLIADICKYSKQHPDEVFMLAKSRFNSTNF